MSTTPTSSAADALARVAVPAVLEEEPEEDPDEDPEEDP
jgi:hypothetical protein